jgi:hypothetical protein
LFLDFSYVDAIFKILKINLNYKYLFYDNNKKAIDKLRQLKIISVINKIMYATQYTLKSMW